MRFWVLVWIAVLSNPAFALTCLPRSVEAAYQTAASSDDPYIIVHGTLSFDEALLPGEDVDNQAAIPDVTRIPARMQGHSLSRAGFKTPFDRPVTLVAQCFGPWCAGAKSGIAYLAFLKKDEGGYELWQGPCGGAGFAEPEARVLKRVRRCFRGGVCRPKTR